VDKNVWLCGPCGASGTAWQLAAFLASCDPSDKHTVHTWLREHGLSDSRKLDSDTPVRRRIEVEAYPYADAGGTLLYQKVRYEPKDFAIRRPDGGGGWLWGSGGVSPVLYNLPEVVNATEVLYVEGEKDVETARKLGLVATTSGAAGSWQKEFAQHLKGLRIHIIADADEPGRKHARQVGADLVGVAEAVRLLELPGAKDLTEWVEHGETKEALLELLNTDGCGNAGASRADPAKEGRVNRRGGARLTEPGSVNQGSRSSPPGGCEKRSVGASLRFRHRYSSQICGRRPERSWWGRRK
jgi:hypothetical protein